MVDFKNGLRRSSEPRMGPPSRMLTVAKNATDEEVQAAAAYFASLQLRLWIRVVESEMVPKTRVTGAMLVPAEGGGTEPIGQRIIETAEDLARTELRDPTSGFVAYVPVASIKNGESLVITGGAGKTIPCGICHGQDLQGLGPVPSLAGRSPSYIVRQLYDIQSGARAGLATQLMRELVARLTVDDMIAIAAYTASRVP
jgi:cytochrome c553